MEFGVSGGNTPDLESDPALCGGVLHGTVASPSMLVPICKVETMLPTSQGCCDYY